MPIRVCSATVRHVLAILPIALSALAFGAGPARAMSLMTQDTNAFFGSDGALREAAYAQSRTMGAGFVRGLVARDAVTDDPDVPSSWAAVDAFVDETRAHGLAPYLTLTYRPANWGDPSTALALPSVAEFSYYCRTAAARYRGRVSDYSVWNEPNGLQVMDPVHPDDLSSATTIPAVTYGQLYRACYDEIKRQDPSANVSFGELATGADSCDYLTDALNPSIPTLADGLAIHPYQWDLAPEQAYPAAPCRGIGRLADWNAVRVAAAASGGFTTSAGGTVSLTITELGYCTLDGECPERAGAANQMPEDARADWIGRAYRFAAANGVTLFGYYHLVKQPDSAAAVKWDTGIVNADGTPTPSVAALEALAGWLGPAGWAGAR